MSTSQDIAITKLVPSDQALLEAIESYPNATDKQAKIDILVDLLRRDRSQVILKTLTQETYPQTAFNFTLWMINHDLITLEWLYDITYQISTQPVQSTINIQDLYASLRQVDYASLGLILGKTSVALKRLRLDDIDLQAFIQAIEPPLALSILTWMVTFQKVTMVDLASISEITRKVNPAAAQASTQPTSSPLETIIPDNPLGDHALEDILLDLNLKLGGTEIELLTKMLDRFLFKKVHDAATGKDKVVYRETIQVSRFVCENNQQQDVPMPVRSTKTWPPGVYLMQYQDESIQIMRLPGNDFYEILPFGPDPYLRAETIGRMVKESLRS
ncbi:hypothetical protein L3556_15180 [Candidatus Synechococcus calcipolaris G9]|uniref:Uncharacterized protein n=1 Tax=Candidatus Synechococcus calcipolaris G9 TaxID=1497997 RepID=A0ABT6F311_9SYNE|nr:hypothetical protein [Candidatus Synechococcus calcipolaris]MDG2992261.1 hypothetical protein [Candidatus Synechococcus calcipolaris G9]